MKTWRNPQLVSFARQIPALRAGTSTPRALLEQCIEAIVARDAVVQAFVSNDFSAARHAADAAGRRYRQGQPLSILDGCPVGIKDIIATADLPTQMNNPAFKDWRSAQDAACVYALRRGGALVAGKTVTTEFAVGYSGPTTNPFDPARTPGGSSSGSAAAIGAGMLPVALGTQTQASTLRPASFNGAVGFKPTHGALPMAGIHPLSATCDHLGLLGATLEDVWLTASQISLGVGAPGYGFLDGAAADLTTLPAALKPQRLIRLYTRGWTELDAATTAAFEDVIEALRQHGVEIVDRQADPATAALEAALEADVDGALDIVAFEMKWPYADYITRFGTQIGERIHGLIPARRKHAPGGVSRAVGHAAPRSRAGECTTRKSWRHRVRNTGLQRPGDRRSRLHRQPDISCLLLMARVAGFFTAAARPRWPAVRCAADGCDGWRRRTVRRGALDDAGTGTRLDALAVRHNAPGAP